MTLTDTWQWTEESFIRAWEAGIFGDTRVELVDGEVWPVSIGPWHGFVTGNLCRALPNDTWQLTSASLPAGGSIPDPDIWMCRHDAVPVSRLGTTGRLVRWSASDVGLVVEVADTSVIADLEIKAKIYGRAGFPAYWVVHRGGLEVLTDPYESGYRSSRHSGPGEQVPVPYRPDVSIPVDEILNARE